MFASEIRRRRVQQLRAFSRWQWHIEEVFVKINGERHYLWRAVDHEVEVLESFVAKTRDKKAALKFLKKSMKRQICGNFDVAIFHHETFALNCRSEKTWPQQDWER